MKRWNFSNMLEAGRRLFAKIHKRKHHAHHNNEIHFMAREIEEWLPNGIQSILDGTYDPRCLKRIYFEDEMVDQLHLADRIWGGGKMTFPHQQAALRMIPHARTLRKAREQVKSMVTDGASPRHIRKYLARWIQWWNETVDDWSKSKLIQWFCRACFDMTPAAYAAGLLLRQIRESRTASLDYAHRDRVLTSLCSAA